MRVFVGSVDVESPSPPPTTLVAPGALLHPLPQPPLEPRQESPELLGRGGGAMGGDGKGSTALDDIPGDTEIQGKYKLIVL